MAPLPADPVAGVPRWLIVVGSALIVLHLGAVVTRALAASSGPWATAEGAGLATPPQFAYSANSFFEPYLKLTHLTDNYHFETNRPSYSAVYFEVRLKDEEGNPLKDDTGNEVAPLVFPDPNANFWVRHRQKLLAMRLGADDTFFPSPERVGAPNRAAPSEVVWRMSQKEPRMDLVTVEAHLLPQNEPAVRPMATSLLLVRSYARHLCRTHGAVKAEVIRHFQDPYPPRILTEDLPAPLFEKKACYFGEFSR